MRSSQPLGHRQHVVQHALRRDLRAGTRACHLIVSTNEYISRIIEDTACRREKRNHGKENIMETHPE